MFEGVSIGQLAAVTAALGMGVVFVALFILSMYMHYFKLLTSRIEGPKRAPGPRKAPPGPKIEAAPRAPGPHPADPVAPVAAAVAVGFHLEGHPGAPSESVAAPD